MIFDWNRNTTDFFHTLDGGYEFNISVDRAYTKKEGCCITYHVALNVGDKIKISGRSVNGNQLETTPQTVRLRIKRVTPIELS